MDVKNERKCFLGKCNNYVYDLHINEFEKYNIDYKYFYNDQLKEKVYNFYINDFPLFS